MVEACLKSDGSRWEKACKERRVTKAGVLTWLIGMCSPVLAKQSPSSKLLVVSLTLGLSEASPCPPSSKMRPLQQHLEYWKWLWKAKYLSLHSTQA